MAALTTADCTIALNAQQNCRLFNLPPELRNYIYELVLLPDHFSVNTNLTFAQAPSPALALTCRQAFHESHLICAEAFADYWSANHFALDMANPPPHFETLPNVSNAALGYIQRLDVLIDFDGLPVIVVIEKQDGDWLVPVSVYCPYHVMSHDTTTAAAETLATLIKLVVIGAKRRVLCRRYRRNAWLGIVLGKQGVEVDPLRRNTPRAMLFSALALCRRLCESWNE